MKITIFILMTSSEVYQKFASTDSAIQWLNRTGYLNQRMVIVRKGNNARVWERIDNLPTLQKEINAYILEK